MCPTEPAHFPVDDETPDVAGLGWLTTPLAPTPLTRAALEQWEALQELLELQEQAEQARAAKEERQRQKARQVAQDALDLRRQAEAKRTELQTLQTWADADCSRQGEAKRRASIRSAILQAYDGLRLDTVESLSTNRAAVPDSVRLPNGKACWEAVLGEVQMRTVECTFGGQTVGREEGDNWGAFSSHFKTEISRIQLREKRFSADQGQYVYSPVTLNLKKRPLISFLRVELDGEEFDLDVQTGLGRLIFLKGVQLPAKARLSVRYTSPLGGEWYVAKQPIVLTYGPTKPRSTFCAVM